MGGLERAKMADYYADLTSRFALPDSLALWRDFSERLHQLATEPEDTERDSIIAQATELKGWPPEIDDQVLEEDVRVARAAPVLAPARTSNVRSDLRDPHLHMRDWLHAPGDRAMGGENPRGACSHRSSGAYQTTTGRRHSSCTSGPTVTPPNDSGFGRARSQLAPGSYEATAAVIIWHLQRGQ
jgi:hypothetical protein